MAARSASAAVLFARFEEVRSTGGRLYRPSTVKVEEPGTDWRALLLEERGEAGPVRFWARAALYAVLFVWGWRFMLSSVAENYVGESFLHWINLPFHEAGHIIFGFFGDFIRSLGGTLGQLLIPAICLGALLLRTRDPFGASVALWWLAENFMDIGPYIADASSGRLLLLGGVTAGVSLQGSTWGTSSHQISAGWQNLQPGEAMGWDVAKPHIMRGWRAVDFLLRGDSE